MLSSVEQAFVGRDEKRAPQKTPAWEAISTDPLKDICNAPYCDVTLLFRTFLRVEMLWTDKQKKDKQTNKKKDNVKC